MEDNLCIYQKRRKIAHIKLVQGQVMTLKGIKFYMVASVSFTRRMSENPNWNGETKIRTEMVKLFNSAS